MKTWKKWTVALIVVLALSVACVGLMLGMTRERIVDIDYGNEVKEYSIRQSIWASMVSKIRYGGKLLSEYDARLREGEESRDILLDISNDFEPIITDMASHERAMVESKITFNKYMPTSHSMEDTSTSSNNENIVYARHHDMSNIDEQASYSHGCLSHDVLCQKYDKNSDKMQISGLNIENSENIGYFDIENKNIKLAQNTAKNVSNNDINKDETNKANYPFEYTLGEAGRAIKSNAYRLLLGAIDSEKVASNLYDTLEPMSLEEMHARTRLIGSYRTEYKTSGDARRKNIHIATGYLDGTIVAPGERLSYNDIVGERTAERGFEEANVIQNGEYVSGYGGGVCQVSTTLYNAWVLSGGEVYYASSHSLPPHYVELSRDAMVSSYNDMILSNNGETPIYVRGYCGIDDVTFEIYGVDNGIKYDIESVVTGTTPIEESIVGEVIEGEEYERVILSEGASGYTSKAYLLSYDASGNMIDRSLLREDEYKCQPRIVKMVKK